MENRRKQLSSRGELNYSLRSKFNDVFNGLLHCNSYSVCYHYTSESTVLISPERLKLSTSLHSLYWARFHTSLPTSSLIRDVILPSPHSDRVPRHATLVHTIHRTAHEGLILTFDSALPFLTPSSVAFLCGHRRWLWQRQQPSIKNQIKCRSNHPQGSVSQFTSSSSRLVFMVLFHSPTL